jgi:general secretion pathway protein H
VEAAITIAILALAVGVVLTNWGSAAADLRRVAGQLSGTVKAAYDEAALTGKTVRIAFSFDKPVIQVEGTEALLSFDEDLKPLARGAALAQEPVGGGGLAGLMMGAAAAAPAEKNGDKKEDEEPPSALTALLGLSKQIDSEEQAPAFTSLGHDLPLGQSVKLLDVWIQGMSEPAKEGVSYLYFFPNGFTQDAIINLTDDDGAVFAVRVAALTGQTTVVPEYMEMRK